MTIEENIYTVEDAHNQFRPRLALSEFLKLTGFDFCWFLLEPLVSARTESELEFVKRLSPGQKALWFWWYLDGQVTNGGFVQFYYNGYGQYIPAILAGLRQINENKVAELVTKVHAIYKQKQGVIDTARAKGEFGSNLYSQFEELDVFDKAYYESNDNLSLLFENYARQNIAEFCLNEQGEVFDKNYTGKYLEHYVGGKIKCLLNVEGGVFTGEQIFYYENGVTKSKSNYLNGELIGLQSEWDKRGVLLSIVEINPLTSERRKELFYENLQLKTQEHTDNKGARKGELKEWYPNGQLKEQATFLNASERIGNWVKFWQSGLRKLEAECRSEGVLFHNYWDEDGLQLLTNGSGLYVNEFTMLLVSKEVVYRYETEYKNYKRHGVSKSYKNGVLQLEQEFFEGVEHGFVKRYDNTGQLYETKIYENGKLRE